MNNTRSIERGRMTPEQEKSSEIVKRIWKMQDWSKMNETEKQLRNMPFEELFNPANI